MYVYIHLYLHKRLFKSQKENPMRLKNYIYERKNTQKVMMGKFRVNDIFLDESKKESIKIKGHSASIENCINSYF